MDYISSVDRIKEGFSGQSLLVIPSAVLSKLQSNPLICQLCMTDMGFFPKAKGHYVNRKTGAKEHILLICMDGLGMVRIEGKEVRLPPGSFIVIEAGRRHLYRADADRPWSIYWAHFKGENCPTILDGLLNQPLTLHDGGLENNWIADLFDRMYQALDYFVSEESVSYASSLLHALLGSLRYPVLSSHGKGHETEKETWLNFLKSNIGNPITLKDMSAFAGLSETYFSVLFKDKTGYSPVQYLNFLRVQKACSSLQHSIASVKEIAHEVGFSDPYYFSRLFKKVMGMSPLHYRKMNN